MSVATQQKILQTVGISIVTMLVLALSQSIVQFTRLFDSNQIVLLFFLFPIIAILAGAAARLMTKTIWATLIASIVAFTVAILVLFNVTALVYVPVYVLLSLFGHYTVRFFRRGQAKAIQETSRT